MFKHEMFRRSLKNQISQDLITGAEPELGFKALGSDRKQRAAHLLAAHVAEAALVGVGVGAEQVGGDGVLQEGVSQHLQALQVEAVAGVGQSQRLQDQARVGSQVPGGVSRRGEVRGRGCWLAV